MPTYPKASIKPPIITPLSILFQRSGTMIKITVLMEIQPQSMYVLKEVLQPNIALQNNKKIIIPILNNAIDVLLINEE